MNDVGSGSAERQYNEAGQTTLVELENGTLVEMEYDSTYGRLTSLTNRSKTGAVMTSFRYTYNADGYVVSVTRESGTTADAPLDTRPSIRRVRLLGSATRGRGCLSWAES